ncbi:PilN domain-containing protein [Cyanobium sp. WAJ14-Wanaka]|uniref:PilN domain-containing protein n=1 Tax=Cyanobium sp. WAJ14-Wanaka TaxID=2823725 RepID=UPI0020CEEBC6|nr:PilN domain-containing protein [Cyanobium sp. WAJ14-Wanaka]MCP9775407.1 PilN domain-containing protein [Cyanobium sp. WAJ14-Wanaka]
MKGEEIPGYLQERWQELQGQLFPRRLRLEITDGGLRGVLLGQQGRGPRLVFEVPLPGGICLAGQPQQIPALGDFIGDLLLEQGLVNAKVAAVLPAEACHWRVVSWPFDQPPDDPLAAIRQLEPELQLVGSLDDWALTYLPLKNPPPQAAQTLLAAAPRSLVQAWQEVFGLAGISLQQLIPAQLQDWHALACNEKGESWFLSLGPQASRLWLTMDGEPQADWPLPGWTPGSSFDLKWQGALRSRQQFWRARQVQDGRANFCCYGPGSDDALLQVELQAELRTFWDSFPVVWLGSDFLAANTVGADLVQEQCLNPGQASKSLVPVEELGGQDLFRQGIWAGAGLLAAMVLAWGGLAFLNGRNQSELAALVPAQAQAELLAGRLQRLQLQVGRLDRGNGSLAVGLVAVQSGSALLAEFRRLTPAGVQLTSLKREPGLLRIQGLASDPQAFVRINALELELQGSGLFEGNDVKLVKASRQDGAPNGPGPAAEPVQFEISAPLAKKAVPLSIGQLRALGSLGMAERQELLRREGLLP